MLSLHVFGVIFSWQWINPLNRKRTCAQKAYGGCLESQIGIANPFKIMLNRPTVFLKTLLAFEGLMIDKIFTELILDI
jgi:hypothetical protein